MKYIKGYEGIYKVNELGEVFSTARRGTIGGKLKPYKHKNPKRNNTFYLRVSLHKDRKRTDPRVHRIVAETFIPNPDNKKQVNHINGDGTDNRVVNLEWCTASENMKHATASGLKKFKSGKDWYIGKREKHIKK